MMKFLEPSHAKVIRLFFSKSFFPKVDGHKIEVNVRALSTNKKSKLPYIFVYKPVLGIG